MQETEELPNQAAIWYLQRNEDVWTQWVPEDVAERVKTALANESD
jgi:glycine betaine/proline transport system substrate-binding protein